MAKLRYDSCESFRSTDEVQAQRKEGACEQRPTARATRRSPRKKPTQSFVDLTGSSDEDADRSRRLTPKVSRAAKKQPGKQICLAPLNALQSSTAAFALAPPAKSLLFPRSPGKTRSPVKSRRNSGSKDVSIAASEPVLEEDDIADDPDAEIEESIWRGSDASPSDSDEDLPSPRQLVRPYSKNDPASQVERSGARDLSKMLEGLKLLDHGSKTLEALPSELSRPASSDKENDGKAILRFSPPRLHSPRKEGQITPERPITPPQLSPSKGKLQSPSKSRARIPTPPHRPSLDAFWNVETVNAWNDAYSPRKEWPRSPKKVPSALPTAPQQSLTSSPSRAVAPASPSKRTKAQLAAVRSWQTHKHGLAAAFLAELDQTLTGGRISALTSSTGGVRLIWTKTLHSTAGRANWKRETTRTRPVEDSNGSNAAATVTYVHHASIELAEKVIDAEGRLLNVLAHEFCHLCTFMLSGVKDRPHGREFQDWGRRATEAFAHRGVQVTTKHSYRIEYKYVWQCANEACGQQFQRHSKSIDVLRHTCGSCRGRLVQIKPVPRRNAAGDGVGGGGASVLTGYAGFVKRHFAEVKGSLPGASHKEVMEALGRKYKLEKEERLRREDSGTSSEVDLVEVDKVARVLEFVTLNGE